MYKDHKLSALVFVTIMSKHVVDALVKVLMLQIIHLSLTHICFKVSYVLHALE